MSKETDLPVISSLMLSFITLGSNTETVESQVRQARDGHKAAREALISDYTPFILKTAASAARKYLVVGRDEEVSVALMAFNEAIDAYTSPKPGFLAFAATVIRRRIVDHFRHKARCQEIPFSSVQTQDGDRTWLPDYAVPAAQDIDWQRLLDRRDEIERWNHTLQDYGLSLRDVVRSTPKHADARARAMNIASFVARDPSLKGVFLSQRRLPLDSILCRIPQELKVSRKTLERQKIYITAIAVVLVYDFPAICEFLDA